MKAINFNQCEKKDKKIDKGLCIYMGVRTKLTCYCVLDGEVCLPWNNYGTSSIKKEPNAFKNKDKFILDNELDIDEIEKFFEDEDIFEV